jgi:hypothetical protein
VKTVSPYKPNNGDPITFTICIFNEEPNRQVQIQEVLDDIRPPVATWVVESCSGTSSSGQAIRCQRQGPGLNGPVQWVADAGGNIVLNTGDRLDLTVTISVTNAPPDTPICNNSGDYTITLGDGSSLGGKNTACAVIQQ